MIDFSAKRFKDSDLSEIELALMAQHLPLYDAIARGLRVPTTAAEKAFLAALQSAGSASDLSPSSDIHDHVSAYRRYQSLTPAPTANAATSSTGPASLGNRLQALLLHRVAHWRSKRAPKATTVDQHPIVASPPSEQSAASQLPAPVRLSSSDSADIATALAALSPEYSAPLDTVFIRSFREDLSVVAAEGAARRRIEAVFDAIERAVSSNRNDPLAEVFATWQLVHRDTLGPAEPLPDLQSMFSCYSEILNAAGLSSQWSLNAVHIPVEDTMSASIRGFAQLLGWDKQTAVSFFTIARGLERTTAATANPVGLLLLLASAAHRVRAIIAVNSPVTSGTSAPLVRLQQTSPSEIAPALWCAVLAGVHSVMMAQKAGAQVQLQHVAECVARRFADHAAMGSTDGSAAAPSSAA